jgi:predicted Fe-Mo cluster-binding NifX family protein
VIANYIVANGGKIGTMEIESIEDRGYEVVITSNVGNSMKTG